CNRTFAQSIKSPKLLERSIHDQAQWINQRARSCCVARCTLGQIEENPSLAAATASDVGEIADTLRSSCHPVESCRDNNNIREAAGTSHPVRRQTRVLRTAERV